mmetsp:Transcript_17012/g.38218  ORF Transcript_17012/g.38218 Transcript_17012/m.38218 type:complete len:734 (-) Transcript_17012:126-2327(-)
MLIGMVLLIGTLSCAAIVAVGAAVGYSFVRSKNWGGGPSGAALATANTGEEIDDDCEDWRGRRELLRGGAAPGEDAGEKRTRAPDRGVRGLHRDPYKASGNDEEGGYSHGAKGNEGGYANTSKRSPGITVGKKKLKAARTDKPMAKPKCSNGAKKGRSKSGKGTRGDKPGLCKSMRNPEDDTMLEWNRIILMANILDHNGPFAVDETELSRRLQYFFEENGEQQVANGTVANSVNSAERGGAVQVSMGPPGAARATAMAHLAVVESYSCVTGELGLYYDKTRDVDCSSASYRAAAAQAAHDVMVGYDDIRGLYSHNATIIEYLDMALEKSLAKEADGRAKSKGIEVGKLIGRIVLEDRLMDGWAYENPYLHDKTYTPRREPGYHDVDPMNPYQSFLSPGAGDMQPFSMSRDEIKAMKAGPPPGMPDDEFQPDDPEYITSLEQVKTLGVFRGGTDGLVPTNDKTYIIANHWSANGSPKTGTPTTLYNDITRKIAMEKCNSEADNMLLFASLNVALADTAISTWAAKYGYELWRPIRAIRDESAGAAYQEDWTPLGASRSNPYLGEINFSPPFPGHTSGHAAFGCAAFQTVADFYQTHDIDISYTSPEWNGDTRDQFNRVRPCLVLEYDNLQDIMAQNAASRVYNGVHFDFEGTMGCESGMEIANYVFKSTFLTDGEPVRETQPLMDIFEKVKDVLDNTPAEGYEAEFCNETPPYPYMQNYDYTDFIDHMGNMKM